MKEEIEPKLEKKEFGKNIVQRDIYYRHGDKTEAGELAPSGFEQGEEIGETLDTTKKGPKPYHSEIERAEDFVKTIQEATKSSKEYKARTRFELGSLDESYSKDFIAQWIKKSKEKSGAAALQWYLEYKKKKPDAGTISPHEIACRVAKNVLTHSKMAERYHEDSKVDLINGSHSPILEIFLANALKEEIEKNPINPEGKTLAEKMGGTFKTAEQFEVDTIIDNKGRKTLKVKFREKEYDLSEAKLKKMVDDLKKIEEEKKEKE